MSQEKIGFILIHGFTGTHFEMQPLENFLKNEGYIVNNITLPGHEKTAEEHANLTWSEIVNYANEKLLELKNKVDKIFVAGLSMGGAISLYLASQNPSITGVIAMSTPYKIPDFRAVFLKIFPFLVKLIPIQYNTNDEIEDEEIKKIHKCYNKYYTKSVFWLMDLLKETRKNLPMITVPTLILHSIRDPSVPVSHAKKIYNKITYNNKTLLFINEGGHIIPEDLGKEKAFSMIKQWVASQIQGDS
ncbi:MAG: alpha/beta hydrolase [Candidatus Heimdallarchaeaceae archaeon]